MPYSASALGVLPPLWSRAAKKPRPVLTFLDWVVFTLPYSGTSRTGTDRGMTEGDEGQPNRVICVRLRHNRRPDLPMSGPSVSSLAPLSESGK
jgi:hypothetical protein